MATSLPTLPKRFAGCELENKDNPSLRRRRTKTFIVDWTETTAKHVWSTDGPCLGACYPLPHSENVPIPTIDPFGSAIDCPKNSPRYDIRTISHPENDWHSCRKLINFPSALENVNAFIKRPCKYPMCFFVVVFRMTRRDPSQLTSCTHPCITAGSPLNYARHSLRSLTIWLFSLPFTLVSEFGVLTAPVMGVISWLLFGVYQIGSTIEDPFQGSLRLSILCDAIFRDVMYDADMKNQRDSAFQLEAELYEWNNEIVPIRAAGQQVLALPIINGSGVLNLTASAGTNSAVEDVSSDTEPHSQSTTPTSSASTTDDPMQPRP